MRWGLVLSLAMLAGCFAKPGAPAAAGGDGGRDGPAPLAFGPWGTPSPVPIGSGTAFDEAPSISSDGRELYFVSSRDTSGRPLIHVATRSDPSEPFKDTAVMKWTAQASGDEHEPSLSASGLDIYFYEGGQRRKHRATLTSAWNDAPADVPLLGPLDFSTDDRLVGGSTMQVTDNLSQIVEYVRTGASWSLVHMVDSPGPDTAPAIRSDGLELFFENLSSSTYVMMRTERDSLADDWRPPTLFSLPNFPHMGDPELSADGRDLYFTSGAPIRIYVVHRDPL